MLRIIIFLFFFVLIPDLYIYFTYITQRTKKKVWRFLYWLPGSLLLSGYVYFFLCAGENTLSEHTQEIGYLAVFTILLLIPKLLFMTCSLTGTILHLIVKRIPVRPFTIAGTTMAFLSFCGVCYGTFTGVNRFEVKEVEYRSDDIPEGFNGYRILQLSDIHIGSWKGKEESIKRLVEIANAQQANLIVFTGDLVNQRSNELEGFTNILSELHAQDGVYSILGNHDYGNYYRWKNKRDEEENMNLLLRTQQEMGWKLLNNEHAIIRHKEDSIALIGVENDGEPPFSQLADLKKATKGTEHMFRILLSHNPTHWRREVLPQSTIPLMLAGHTHAMQGILFGHSLAEFIYPEWRGMYYEGDRALYVNIGIGYIGLPFRFGAWPEITVITLRK